MNRKRNFAASPPISEQVVIQFIYFSIGFSDYLLRYDAMGLCQFEFVIINISDNMKKSLILSAAAFMTSASAFAQSYITSAPEGGFDVISGKDYVVLYAPADVMSKMGDRLISDQNLDKDQVRNYIMYWVTDWDPKDLTLYNVPEENGRNSFGGEDYINATPLYEWGTGAFTPISTPYDLSKVTDDHYLHIGLRDFGSAPSKYQFTVGPNASIKSNGFQIEVGSP